MGEQRRVDFMIIGAQKSGTTSLAAQLRQHPQVCFCRHKEPAYFNRAADWRQGLGDYHALYSPREGQICAEASTMYTFLPEFRDTHERLFAYNPELKLIYLMRQPVERILSHYSHRLLRGRTAAPPEVAVLSDPSYVNRSRYGVQIRPYLELFGRERVLLLLFEEYVANPTATLERIAAFLGIASRFPHLDPGAKNRSVGIGRMKPSARKLRQLGIVQALLPVVPRSVRARVKATVSIRLNQKPDFSPELRETLWRLLEDDVRSVEALLGRSLKIWRDGGKAVLDAGR